MSGLDFLYICLGIGFLVLIGVISITLYSLASFLMTLKEALKEIKYLRTNLKIGFLSTLKNLLNFSLIKRGGE